jgi:hypothetical protein
MEENTLLETGPAHKRFRIRLDSYQDQPLLDLRYWYVDKSSGNLKPSSKGISITGKNYLELRSAVTDHHDVIMNHLNVNSMSFSHAGDKALASAHQVSEQQPVREIVISYASFSPASKLYYVDYEGSVARVYLNCSHPLIDKSNVFPSIKDESVKFLATILVAIDQTFPAENEDGDLANILSQQFRYEFQRQILQLARIYG